MSHLPRQLLFQRIQQEHRPLVENTAPFHSPIFDECLQPDSLDVRIGAVLANGLRVVDASRLEWQLPPGEMAIIVTREVVNMPAELAGEVSPRASILNDGVLVLAAPHIDPGYSGPLTARIINLLDKPYLLTFEAPMLTVRFYELILPTDRPSQDSVSMAQKVDRALKESRDTFNRLFLKPEEVVFKDQFRSLLFVEGYTWVALLLAAVAFVIPFSWPFFWSLGAQFLIKYPAWVTPVAVVVALIVIPLFLLYIRLAIKVVRLCFTRSFWLDR